jgi:hypothetical protein
MKKKYEEYVAICKLLGKSPYMYQRWLAEYRDTVV